ncbi:hypothetical protein C8F01DRAFT_1015641 [Mycena amicta]|nr:hypothetical protein C8F01DRAFT_1015641 [Mycena amicta]
MLPTPPHTGHRASKENRWHVNWSPQNQYRTFTHDELLTSSASKSTPAKSILKKKSEPLLPLIDALQRHTTPEPSRPETDPSYLSSPVLTIADSDASLDDLIRAYSVLAARLRAHITLSSNSKTPLLFPLRAHRAVVVEAIIRDLARCSIDPESMEPSPEDLEEEEYIKEQRMPAAPLLPSPKNSPKKKKKGTTARKAKYGRDLCTTCHSVLKLLGVIFTLPAVYNLFNVPELRAILTEVLGIPLADDLPTPNARKTYALSIWLLQTQRLPASVLVGASDRIAFALRRGIDGELGKEGKKGSASDGLKAIHDLCVYQPAIFVPKFEALIPSVLDNLMASTLTIRTQASHALGGLARGLTVLPISSLHTRISAAVVSHLTAPPPAPKSPTKSPVKSTEAAIVRTLRLTMSATEVQNVAQGPVWALTAMAALLVLANSGVYASVGARKVFGALLPVAMNHQKSSVRGIACAVWRCATWAYCQPLLPLDGGDESEVDEDGGSQVNIKRIDESRNEFWTRIISSTVEMGVGTSTVAALLEESEHAIEDNVALASVVLKSMTAKNDLPTAIEILARMVSYEEPEMTWNWNKLLPRGLLSASPGLLTAEYKSLEAPLRAVMAQCPTVEDVRSLYRDELIQSAIFDKLVSVWRECIGCLGMQDDEPVLPNIVAIWRQLLQAQISAAQENEDDQDSLDWAAFAVDTLLEILNDSNIDVTLKHGHIPCADGPEPKNNLSNAALKIKLLRALWGATRQVCCGSRLAEAAEKLVYHLMKGEDEFTDCGDASRTEWATFCADVLVICDPEDVQEFWKYDGAPNSKWEWTPEIRSTVWRCFAEQWKEDGQAAWPAIAILLAVPFSTQQDWNLEGTDLDLWEGLLKHGIAKGLDYGLDRIGVLDHAAAILARDRNPTASGASRIADVLLSCLIEDEDLRELPESLLELVNDILESSYPPERRIRQQALWTLRTVSRTIELCPIEHVLDLLRLLEGGLCVWLSDEHHALSEDDYLYDVVNLYEVFLMKITTVPMGLDILASTAPIFAAAFTGPESIPPGITDAFCDFWVATYDTFPGPHRWPEEIAECLAVVDPKSTLSPAFGASSFKIYKGRLGSTSPEAAVPIPTRPVTPSPSSNSTPPRRPHKLPSTSETSPESPIRASYLHSSPSTPKRTALRIVSSGSRSSPNKRRRIDDGDKENESPRPVFITSVLDRVAMASPASKKHGSSDRPGVEEGANKRRRLSDESEGIAMAPRFESKHDDGEDEEEERLVAVSLVEREQDAPSSGTSSNLPPKKRKRGVMEAVVVPAQQAAYNRTKQNEVEVRSTAKAVRRGPSFSRKRGREDSDDSDDPFSDDSRRSNLQSSSDDDLYLNQVTPSHVVSPALRRARDDDPPSSDDSISSNSPLKSLVARRLQRMGSNGRTIGP